MLYVSNILSLALSLGTFPFYKVFFILHYRQCHSVPLVRYNWVPNHKGMVRTEVADGESHLRRLVANILNKQWSAADNCGPSEKWLGEERYKCLQHKPPE